MNPEKERTLSDNFTRVGKDGQIFNESVLEMDRDRSDFRVLLPKSTRKLTGMLIVDGNGTIKHIQKRGSVGIDSGDLL